MEKFTITPSSITHHRKPAFKASWFSGGLFAHEEGCESFFYEGSGEEDSLLIYQIEWMDEKPDQEVFNQMMDEAITAIDHWICGRF